MYISQEYLKNKRNNADPGLTTRPLDFLFDSLNKIATNWKENSFDLSSNSVQDNYQILSKYFLDAGPNDRNKIKLNSNTLFGFIIL